MAQGAWNDERRASEGTDSPQQCAEGGFGASAKHFRGYEHPLFRTFRRPRHRRTGAYSPAVEGYARPEVAPLAHEEGKRLQTCRKRGHNLARARQIRRADGRENRQRRGEPSAEIPRRFRRNAARTRRAKRANRRRYTGDADGLFDEYYDGKTAQSNLRCGHCRRPRRHVLGRYGERRFAAVLQHLFRLRATRLRQHHPRHGDSESARRVLPRPRRTRRRGRPDAPRSLRYGLSAPDSQPHDLFADGRARTAPPDVHRATARQRHFRHSLSAWLRRADRLALSVGGGGSGNRSEVARRRRCGGADHRADWE